MEDEDILDGGVESCQVSQYIILPATSDVYLGRAKHSLTQILYCQQEASLGLERTKQGQ